ncbi:MAG: DEAD/DEAH box helicase [Desulfobulbus sp.]|nr:DEAD/DEAH box helicase [Desulfobulbus sp.]
MGLLRQGKLSHFFIYRNSAACICNAGTLSIVFKPTSRISAGFSVQEEHCELCALSDTKKRCAHIAALCILSLHKNHDAAYTPLPLLFKQSQWGKTSDFLYNWLSNEKGSTRFTPEENVVRLEKETKEGTFNAVISAKGTTATTLLDPMGSDSIHTLYNRMQQRCITKNEQLLIKAGMTSKGLLQEGAIWTRLCALAYCCVGDAAPDISYSAATGCFQFEIGDDNTDLHISTPLPRANTYELLKNFDKLNGQFRQLPDGRPGSNVSLTAEGNIVVRPIVRLDDERVMRLSDLHNHKFGNHYYLHGEGFFRIGPADNAAKITAEKCTQTSPSLFTFLRKDEEVILEHKDVADFLERNSKQLLHPDNQVDPEVLEIRYIHIPDRLLISELREEDGWIVLACQFGIGKDVVSLPQLIQHIQTRQPLTVGLTTLELHEGPLAWLYQLFTKNRSTVDETHHKTIALTRGEFACLIGAIPVIEHQHNSPKLQQTLERLTASGQQNQLNTAIRYQDHLRDYQKEGLSWLFTLYELGLGGILADDMGLGKTHQALALIETIVRETTGSTPILVVCPASVLLHWADKINRFYPDLQFALYYSPNRNLDTALQQRIILTTYAVARGDQDALEQCSFDLIVFDEIQALKNRNTATHQACKAFRSRVAIGLSGTPIENSVEDLFAIFSICLPGFFGTFKTFQHTFLTPIEKFGSVRKEELLSEKIQPFLLRRSRTKVLVELPELIEDDRSCELSGDQLLLYRETIAEQQLLLDNIADQEARVDYLHVFAMLTRLKQICDHPCLVEKCTDPNQYSSGKWDLFLELLDESLENGRKVVVFSQYIGMLDLMAHHLSENDIGFATLRGDMNIAKRQAMIDQFATDSQCMVFLASLLAGGTGIDLIAGNVVIHYDRWWNPAKENQATARVHRMGQQDVVHLFRLSTQNTLEEKIDKVLANKQQLSDSIIKEDDLGMIKQLSREQLLELFTL